MHPHQKVPGIFKWTIVLLMDSYCVSSITVESSSVYQGTVGVTESPICSRKWLQIIWGFPLRVSEVEVRIPTNDKPHT